MHKSQEQVAQLLENSGADLHALLVRLTLSQDDAGDLLQELFIKLSKSNGLEKAQNPAAYAFRAAINLAMDWRRQRPKQPLSLDLLAPLTDQDQPNQADQLIRREEYRQVLDAVARLKGLAREVVVRRYLQQQTYAEIAQQLGKKPQYLRSVCTKALARLRAQLNKENATTHAAL